MKLGLIAYANDGGLGVQTKRLVKLIKPDKILVIDSSRFSWNKKQHFEWYQDYNHTICDGFPTPEVVDGFLPGLTHLIDVENPYSLYMIWKAQKMGIKYYCQTNYEFLDNVAKPYYPVPDLFLMPSYWKLKEMKKMFGDDRVVYLPPPLDPKEFGHNDNDHTVPHFLHIVGTLAFKDRNGTLELLKAIKLSKGDYKITIHSQHQLPIRYIIEDPRISYRFKNFENNADIYKGFDALILPRRYGGLSLTTNEALMSGMSVMMTDCSPNNEWLPKDWLIPVSSSEEIETKVLIDSYTVDVQSLAQKMDDWSKNLPKSEIALKIAMENFSIEVLEPRYRTLL